MVVDIDDVPQHILVIGVEAKGDRLLIALVNLRAMARRLSWGPTRVKCGCPSPMGAMWFGAA